MTQTLNPLYGDYLNDTTLAKSGSYRGGLVIAPGWVQAPSGAAVQVTLNPDTDLGLWAWKSRFVAGQGSFTFTEDAPVVVVSLDAGANPYQLLMARWQQTAGPLDVDGNPTGAFTPAMHAIYGFEAATLADMTDNLLATTLAQPDINGRYGVPIGRLLNGIFSFISSTMLDLAVRGSLTVDSIQIDEVATGGSGGTPHATIQNPATITGTSSKLQPTTNTGLVVEFTARKACSVVLGGSHFVYGTDDGNPGGGSSGYIMTVSKNGTPVKATEVWLSNVPSAITPALDILQVLVGSSGSNLQGNITFPMIVVQLLPGDTLNFTFNDRDSFFHWITLNWTLRMNLGVY